MRKASRGFSLLSMLIVIGFVAMLGLSVADFNRQVQLSRPVEKFSLRLLDIRTMMHAWHQAQYTAGMNIHDRSLWPNHLQAFENLYVPTCTTTDADNGRCTPIDHTPWGKMTYSVETYITPTGFRSYYAKLEFSVPDEGDDLFKTQYNAMHEFLSPISGMTWDETANIMTYRIDLADLAFAFDGLVKRSGDNSSLLGDWDVGGQFAITNAKEFTLADSQGGQISVSNKLVQIFVGQHGDWVNKPTCITGQSPDIYPSITEINVSSDYTLLGSQKAYQVDDTTNNRWQLGLDILVTHNTTGDRRFIHTGVITALIKCK
ncbi:hypothetical protein MD535_22290 [Vibrio sp. ZSDZ65]|uniref:Type II secretion system protein n=1 Tax=Vibrio qingdaonensis TaxID=2829491 RepID=A0A9X3CS54_9VIBR|nr:hypothetical protein [Vibrio qingdaonensis]MCW8348722.1 hypothetical protein [Vibrio qingdaonensis]